MRPLMLAFALSLGVAAPAHAMDEALTFHMVRAEIDAARIDDADVVNWDADAWVGGERNKLWLKSEGELEDGDTSVAEIQALWSHAISDYWDVQAGVRVDIEPDEKVYLALGMQGLAPYQFETDATAFLSEDGDLSARVKQSLDLRFTQRLIAEPHIEVTAHARDVPEQAIGAGLSTAEAGVQLRYEISRKFAPYVDLVWERSLGETAMLRRAEGEDAETASLRAGLRFWF
jgi:copper resistance protein B